MSAKWRSVLVGLGVLAMSVESLSIDVVQLPLSELVASSYRIARVRVMGETAISEPGSATACKVYDVEVVESLKGAGGRFRFAEVTPPADASEFLVFVWKYPAADHPIASDSREDALAVCSRSPAFPGVVTRPDVQTMIPLERGHSRNSDRLWLVAERPSAVSSLPVRREITPERIRDFFDWGLAKEEIVLLDKDATPRPGN